MGAVAPRWMGSTLWLWLWLERRNRAGWWAAGGIEKARRKGNPKKKYERAREMLKNIFIAPRNVRIVFAFAGSLLCVWGCICLCPCGCAYIFTVHKRCCCCCWESLKVASSSAVNVFFCCFYFVFLFFFFSCLLVSSCCALVKWGVDWTVGCLPPSSFTGHTTPPQLSVFSLRLGTNLTVHAHTKISQQ